MDVLVTVRVLAVQVRREFRVGGRNLECGGILSFIIINIVIWSEYLLKE